MPKVFGWQHLIYLGFFAILSILTIVLSKKFLKTEKSQAILIKVVAGLTLLTVILCRIGVVVNNGQGMKYFLPNTFCGFTSFVFSIVVIFGKPNLKSYQCFFYMAVVGGLATLIYPDFIGQNESFMYLPTITGFLHHSFCLLLAILMAIFGWFKPDFKTCYYFPMIYCTYIIWGLFDMTVIGVNNAMCITTPLLSGTPLYWWFVLIVGSLLVALFSFVYQFVCNNIKNKNREKEL